MTLIFHSKECIPSLLPFLYEHQWYMSVKCKGLKSFLGVLVIYAAICREAAKPILIYRMNPSDEGTCMVFLPAASA